MTSQAHPTARGRTIAINTVWNVAGVALPTIAAVASIPLLAKHLGPAQFGLLGVVWAVAGYFGLLDLGLGKALTRSIAAGLGREDASSPTLLARTTLVLLGVLGFIGAVTLFAGSNWFATSVLQMTEDVETTATVVLQVLAASIPLTLVSAGMVATLEGFQRFDLVNIVRTPFGIATFALPAIAVAVFGAGLAVVVIVIVAARLIAVAAYGILLARVLPPSEGSGWFEWASAKSLLRFGGWLTVSNIATPFLMSSDRIVIGIVLSVTAVGFYTAPYEIAIRVLVIPVAISSVTFAAMSTTFAASRETVARIMRGSAAAIFVILYPISFVLVVFADEILTWWVGGQFAAEGAVVLQILAFGVLANGLATAAFVTVLAGDRPDWTAKLHMIEVPVYLAALFIFVPSGGIEAAAAIWTSRVVVDAIVVAFLANKLAPVARRLHLYSFSVLTVAVVLVLVASRIGDTTARAIFALGSFVVVGGALALRFRAETSTDAPATAT